MSKINNLTEALKAAAEHNTGITFVEGEEKIFNLRYSELLDESLELLFLLQTSGVKPGDEMIFQLESNHDFIVGFWACILGGIIPVPISLGNNEEHRIKVFKIWEILNNPYILTTEKAFASFTKHVEELSGFSETLSNIKQKTIIFDKSSIGTVKGEICYREPDDIAFIQFSSGSTGTPKGVVLTHKNLLSNINAIINGTQVNNVDSALSWMPLTHDMGLIGFHLTPLCSFINQYIMPTTLFIRRPSLWLSIASKYRITILSSPNFGYKYLLDNINLSAASEWDLSFVRILFNGAEPIDSALCEKFTDNMSKYGLLRSVMFNVYGLAEASLAVTFPPLGEGVRELIVDRDSLSVGETVRNAEIQKFEKAVTMVDLGYPVNDCHVKICDDKGNTLNENTVGNIIIKGDNVTKGYYNNNKATKDAINENGWLNTGDLGFMRDGRLVVSGRAKDVIFINGQNFYAHDIERIVESISGIELGEIAACGIYNTKLQMEELSLFVLFRKDIANFIKLSEGVKNQISERLGVEVKRIIPVKKINKTTSGKIQRFKLRERFQNGEFAEIENEIENLLGMLESHRTVEDPIDDVEEKLVELWKELLDLNSVSTTDDFLKMGGNSLKAAMLLNRLNCELGVDLCFNDIYELRTIKRLADVIKKSAIVSHVSINAIDKMDYYPVSSAQKRIYLLSQLEGAEQSYNMPYFMRVEGNLDLQCLKATFKKIVKRHEAFRTTFELIDGEPVQRVHEEVNFDIICRNISKDNIEIAIKDFVRQFELNVAPLMRIELAQLNNNSYILMFDMHHIISDGTSMGILINEFVSLYNNEVLPELKINYKDFAYWQNNFFASETCKKQEEYWLNLLDGELPVLDLCTDYSRPAKQSFEGNRIKFSIEKNQREGLCKLAEESGSSLYMVLLSIFNVLLYKYTGQEDIIIGTPIMGRQHTDLAGVIGMFVNSLAMRNNPRDDLTFIEFLDNVRKNALNAFGNQSCQFERLVEKLSIQRDFSRNPVFDIMFTLQNMEIKDIEIEGLKFTPYEYETGISKFDITMQAKENDNGIKFEIEYCTQLFKKETIEFMSQHFRNIITQVLANPELQLYKVNMMSEVEKEKILFDFNTSQTDCPKDKTLSLLFEEQVAQTPEAIALVMDKQTVTYRELNSRANRLARFLRKQVVGTNIPVGILMDRSIEMIVCILGILKSGGCYLPIDISNPAERIKVMLEDSSAKTVLVDANLLELNRDGLECDEISIFCIDDILTDLNAEDDSNLEALNKANDLVYIMYTSGSTGVPKGNLTTHYNVARIVKNSNFIDINQHDVMLQISNYAFDGSPFDIFGALLNGAKLVLVRKETLLDMFSLTDLIAKEGVTLFFITTALFNTLIDVNPNCIKNVRKILFGGERVSVPHVRSALQTIGKDKLIHVYGPTESTIFATYYNINSIDCNATTIPIGKPVSNTRLYILDKHGNLQPSGVAGELYISGDGVALGYLNRPDLTNEKFLPNPYESGAKMYRTGDLVRWLNDGNIEFLDRIDHQVKLRGFRIELGEIESALLNCNGIKEAFVCIIDDRMGCKNLCAYIVSDKHVSIDVLRDNLSAVLPDFMIPAYFINLEKLPVNMNGKVDRKSLPGLESVISDTHVCYEPENELQAKLQKIWCESLKLEQVGINQRFFELGGHSLTAAVIVSKIFKEISINVPLKEVFKAQTIRKLAEYISTSTMEEFNSIQKTNKKDYYPLTPSQKGLFVQSQFEGIGVSYNIPLVFTIDGELNIESAKKAFAELVKRHEALRTAFIFDNGEPVQKIFENVLFEVKVIEAIDEDLDNTICNFVSPFELNNAPLFRVSIAILGNKKYAILIDMNHIISDGISVSVLLEEFAAIYKEESLPEVSLHFKDYAVWYEKFLNSEKAKKQEEFWKNTLSGEIPILNLPYDFPRSECRTFDGGCVKFEINYDTKASLESLSKKMNVTMNVLMLGVYTLLLNKYTEQDELIIGSLVSGRNHPDIARVIGMFNNFVPLRLRVDGNDNFKGLLASINETTLNAYENQDYPYEWMVENFEGKSDRSRNPLFDTMLIFHNELENTITFEVNSLKFYRYEFNNKTSKLDLKLDIFNSISNSFDCYLEFNRNLFHESTVKRLAEHYVNILEQIAKSPEIRLSDIDMLSETERTQILHDFNNTSADYPKEKTIDMLFEEQVLRVPEKTAATFEGKILTYSELNGRANRLARTLRNMGTGPEKIVAVMLDRSLEMTVGLMSILKAGGAYLPINPDNPVDRIKYILEDSGATILLTQECFMDKFSEEEMLHEKVKLINLDDENVYDYDSSNLERINNSNNLAYVIYTSGSTGKPKGAMIEHYSLVNRLNWMQKMYPIKEGDVILQKTPYTFDVSVWELFWWSICGASVCFLTPGGEKDPEEIIKAIQDNGITTMHFVPSMLNTFLEYLESRGSAIALKSLRQVFASGEALNLKQVEMFSRLLNRPCGTKLHNLYGPTEAAIDVSYFDCSTGEELKVVPIGKPIDNIKLYILDKNNMLCPKGIPGELCISGDGVGRGYLNKPELTAEKFVQDPFFKEKRMYRTGDLARWMPDGNIEYMGRLDFQVKIRGNRIELGEIEAELLKIEKIKETVVAAKEDKSGNKYLCAYYVSDTEFTVQELKSHLLVNLPEYMIPSFFIKLDKIPLSGNGKADRKALPEPEGAVNTGVEYKAADNNTEIKLVQMWQELLGLDRIGTNDNFFDLGGNSLLLIKMHSKLEEIYPEKLKVTDLFANPTILKLAEYIDSISNESMNSATVEYVTLPLGFFNVHGTHNIGSTLNYIFDSDMISGLNNLTSSLDCKVEHILLALYIHLLSQISQMNTPVIQVSLEEGKDICAVAIDVSTISDFTVLVAKVKEACTLPAYSFENLRNSNVKKGSNQILPLFLNRKVRPQKELLKCFDIIIELFEHGQEFEINCEYDGRRICKEKIIEIFNNFIKFIKLSIES